MTLKIPPPPSLPVQFQQLNRWLIELQSILNSDGNIDPTNVAGLVALVAQVAANTVSIATNTAAIAANTTSITTINGEITTINGEITSLTARNQILNGAGVPGAGLGNNGDLYSNTTGGTGTNLYSKRAGAWVAIA